ncbi:sporulation protein-like protein RMD1 [Xylona heveae TC161]|uniref:Sporulation protein-like protein RMD1 n=1 Tax=Xylona heveae (strain CBS 132557 / TC161) TaxID=1328760 RepID=A0A165G1H3_XYLHT|nr:sporulation protein-like protein RMD1 [Xylona heveae TC161]KZF21631.1 sporulation protein-like protein RMD1 [Xylona heveae TC161]
MATTTESTPLMQSTSAGQTTGRRNSIETGIRPARTVTFSPSVLGPTGSSATTTAQRPSTSAYSHAPQPMLSALNSKLRRRNSHGSPLVTPQNTPAAKIGPQRTTRTAQKLKLLPNPELEEEEQDEESGRDVYSQFTRIKDPTARRDAARLGKADRDKLPRVTAYCTANAYQLEGLVRFLKGKARSRGAMPKLIDECVYTPYNYGRSPMDKEPDGSMEPRSSRSQHNEEDRPQMRERRFSDSELEVEGNTKSRRDDLIDLHTEGGDTTLATGEHDEVHRTDDVRGDTVDFDTEVHTPEVFLFNYGTVVIWGMTLKQEQRFLKEIAKFEQEKLSQDDVQTEDFNFYYTRDYQARIYNDFISLRDKRNYMTKLAISHALAQSVKTSLFEDLVDNTIEMTKDIPERIALEGKVNLTRRQLNMQIGELFILRINIHLQGSVLDSPELMWAEPQLEPIYVAVRSYLEMDQRVGLLTERLDVIADLLAVLRDQQTHTHGEYLEWIVIVLIAAEILVAAINIVVDLYAGVD